MGRFLLPIFLLLVGVASATAAPSTDINKAIQDGFWSGLSIILPWLVIGFCISLFFSLVRKKPEKAAIGCISVVGIGILIGILISVVDFIKQHPVVFFVIGLAAVIITLICYMKHSSVEKPTYESFGDNEPSIANSIGMAGENYLVEALHSACKRDGRFHIILRNLYIPTKNGTTEIDVLLLHETGIYVFESKNVSGNVVGKMEYNHWLLYNNSSIPQHFVNPLQQNSGHIAALRNYLKLGYRNDKVFSIVVFGKSATLKSIPKLEKGVYVLVANQLSTQICGILKNHNGLCSQNYINRLYQSLLPCVNVSQNVKEAHIQRLTQKFGKI